MNTARPRMAWKPQIHVDEIGLAFATADDLHLKTLRLPTFALRAGRLCPVAFTAALAISRRGQGRHRDGPSAAIEADRAAAVQTTAWRLHVLNHQHVAVDADLALHVAAEVGARVDDAAGEALLDQAREAEMSASRLVVDLSDTDPACRPDVWKKLTAAGARISMTLEAASQLPADFRYAPHIVRIAAPWFAVWGKQSHLSRLLEPTIALLHRRGSSVQIEGIDSVEQMRVAADASAGYFQGDLLEKEALAGVPFDERPRRLDRYVGENVVSLFA